MPSGARWLKSATPGRRGMTAPAVAPAGSSAGVGLGRGSVRLALERLNDQVSDAARVADADERLQLVVPAAAQARCHVLRQAALHRARPGPPAPERRRAVLAEDQVARTVGVLDQLHIHELERLLPD